MKNLKWIFMICIGCCIILGVIALKLLPKKDRILVTEVPEQFMIADVGNYIQYQGGQDCAGYASAYILRQLGYEIEGPELFEKMIKVSDGVNLYGVKEAFKQYDCKATAYYGNINTMKMHLAKGVPVMVHTAFTAYEHGPTHFSVVVGYDEEFIYLADSASIKANCAESEQYNRKLTYEEFGRIWKTDSYPVDNVYVCIES